MVVNVHEAKTQLSRLIDRAAAGEEIVLGKSGKPMARLVPYRSSGKRREPGALRGAITMADDFDELPGDLLNAFEGDG